MPESKLSIGNVEILALTDHQVVDLSAFPLGQLFPGVPAEAWAPYQQRTRRYSTAPISGATTTAATCFALRGVLSWWTQGQEVLPLTLDGSTLCLAEWMGA